MTSPICEVKDGSGAYAPTANGVNVTPGDTVTIRLIDSSARTWSISCVYTDDQSVASTVTASLVIDPIARTATFTAPVAGRAYIFRSVVNNGVGPDGRVVSEYSATFGVYTLTTSGQRVLAANETTEGDTTFGWTKAVNSAIRNGGGGGLSSFFGKSLASATPSRGDSAVYDSSTDTFKPYRPVPPNWYDVRSFGAVGDGTADDTTAIGNAITAASTAGGGTVYVPHGRYKITSQLPDLGSNVRLLGATRVDPYYTSTKGTFFETYVDDTVIYFGQFDDTNISIHSAIENIVFVRKVDTSMVLQANVTAATNASPIVLTLDRAVPWSTGDKVTIRGVVGNTAANGTFTATVVDSTHVSLNGSTGNGAYTSGGKIVSETYFNAHAGAAVEARGATFIEIINCRFLDYPIGVCLDGAESVLIERCFIGGLLTGYSGLQNYAYGLFLADGPIRRRGWTLGGSTNHITVRDCVLGGPADNVYCYGGVGQAFEDINFEGGVHMFRVGGVDLLTIKRCLGEGYGSNSYMRFEATSLNVALEHNFLAGATTSIEIVGAINQLTMIGNRLGSPPGGTAIVGGNLITHLSAFNNWQPQPGCMLLDAEPAGSCIGAGNVDASGATAGISVNRGRPAQALLDGRLTDPTYPIVLVQDTNGYTRFKHNSPTQYRHHVEYRTTSSVTGYDDGGVFGVSDWVTFEAGTDTADTAPVVVGDQILSVFEFEVLQWHSADPTKYAHGRYMQKVYKYGGAITFIGSPSPLMTAEDTDGSFVVPTLVDDGAGNVVVRVKAHPTQQSRAQVSVRALIARR